MMNAEADVKTSSGPLPHSSFCILHSSFRGDRVSTDTDTDTAYDLERKTVEQLRAARDRIIKELSKVVVGQHDVVEQLLYALFSGGHCLITGAPGLAKTLLVR